MAKPVFRLIEHNYSEGATIPMILHCPQCSERHVDEGDFAEKPHHTHACQSCGFVWRPAKVNTHGVRFLPGYLNEAVDDGFDEFTGPGIGDLIAMTVADAAARMREQIDRQLKRQRDAMDRMG